MPNVATMYKLKLGLGSAKWSRASYNDNGGFAFLKPLSFKRENKYKWAIEV